MQIYGPDLIMDVLFSSYANKLLPDILIRALLTYSSSTKVTLGSPSVSVYLLTKKIRNQTSNIHR